MKKIALIFLLAIPTLIFSQTSTTYVKKSPKKLYYFIGGLPMGEECNVCSKAVYEKYGVGTKAKGVDCLSNKKKSKKINKHNEDVTAELIRLNGKAWLDQMNDELTKCCYLK